MGLVRAAVLCALVVFAVLVPLATPLRVLRKFPEKPFVAVNPVASAGLTAATLVAPPTESPLVKAVAVAAAGGVPELPAPPPPPLPLEVLREAIAARLAAAGVSASPAGAPAAGRAFVPLATAAAANPLAARLAEGAVAAAFGGPAGAPVAGGPPAPAVFGGAAPPAAAPLGLGPPAMGPSTPAPPLPAPAGSTTGAAAPLTSVAPSLGTAAPAPAGPPVRRGPPPPPACAAAPPHPDVAAEMAPATPPGASGAGIETHDGGTAWPLQGGGWAFQYPEMAVRMELGTTHIAFAKPSYLVEYNDTGISYHVGDSVVRRGTDGDLSFQQATGTVHQEGDTLVYHWCNPNMIVYQTPTGIVYYDDDGMTYRGENGITHYAASGDIVYQGPGGVTHQKPDGTVAQWTEAGAVYQHQDGSLSYTPVGTATSMAMGTSLLGPDPFPGPPLTAEAAMALAGAAPTTVPPCNPECNSPGAGTTGPLSTTPSPAAMDTATGTMGTAMGTYASGQSPSAKSRPVIPSPPPPLDMENIIVESGTMEATGTMTTPPPVAVTSTMALGAVGSSTVPSMVAAAAMLGAMTTTPSALETQVLAAITTFPAQAAAAVVAR